MVILEKSLKTENFSLGFSLLLPFIWLILYSPFN
jgi:hypothetical protein